MFYQTVRQSKSAGSQQARIVGGDQLKNMKNVIPAGNSYPPYMIMSKIHGERNPQTFIRILASPINQNQKYDEGKSKPSPTQGGKKQAPYYQFPLPDKLKDGYKRISQKDRRYLPKKTPNKPPDALAEETTAVLQEDDQPSADTRSQPEAITEAKATKAEADFNSSPQPNFQKGGNQQQGQMQGASEACADAFDPTWEALLELQMSYLINVANENAGAACSGRTPVKIHENAVWMVMQMYKQTYLMIALLILLPGAVITQLKGLVSGGILQSVNDEDAVSPFTGIFRGMIAIFLIPCTQMIVSYSCDIGNSMSYEVKRRLNVGVVTEWAAEQVFRAPEDAKEDAIKHPSMKSVQGKMSEGSEKQSGVEAQSLATIMLQLLANLTGMSAAFGLVMMCAFQISMMCYLFLLGPIAAAFYAWPTTVGTLFKKVFAVWVDAVVNVGLWRFFWLTVILCAQTRIEWLSEMGSYDPYSEWELMMFISFMTILTYVPFNPFDFKPGEMVAQIMQKAEQAVDETANDAGSKKGKK